ncbi:hypothetical protein KAI32_02340 [Candidatus Pacearchaeota archaeon]|nr:hypothetical protein [Candidatus Pacearchaeota archaeon]
MVLESYLSSTGEFLNDKYADFKKTAKKGLIGVLTGTTLLMATTFLPQKAYGDNVTTRDLVIIDVAKYGVNKFKNPTNETPKDKPLRHWCSLDFNKYKDFNDDGEPNQTEILEPINNGDSINLDNVGIAINISTNWDNERAYSIVNSDYDILATIRGPSAKNIMYASGNSASNSFMEVLNNLDAGDYILYGGFQNGTEKFSKKFSIVRDSPTKSISNNSK